MDYISQPPTNVLKGNIECVLKCTKFPGKQANDYMFGTNFSSIEQQYKKLGYALQKKGGRIITHALCLITSYYHLQKK